MENVLVKIVEQSVALGVVLVMYYFQREDNQKTKDREIENIKVLQSLQFSIEKLTERLSNRSI